MRYLFGLTRLKSTQNMKVLMVSITQACTFECQRQEIYIMETKIGNLLGNGNTLNMLEIQKYWNKIFQKDGYLHSKIHCTVLRTIFFFFDLFLKLVYFLDLLNLKLCKFLFVNKTNFIQVLRIYAYLCKSCKHFFTDKLIQFQKQGY